MSDWNPAEIIGIRPRRLAQSLYSYLITDDVWAAQRAEFGYRDIRPAPLMVSFAGHPYIDIRASFNSFIPAGLPNSLAAKLLNYYMDRIEAHPQLHDKIEFEIVFSCATFDLEEKLEKRLAPKGFSQSELECIVENLAQINRTSLSRVSADLAEVENLNLRYLRLLDSELEPLDRAMILLEDCKRFGTLPFAHLARSGFVAVELLRSLCRQRYFKRQRACSVYAFYKYGFLRDCKRHCRCCCRKAEQRRVYRALRTFAPRNIRYLHSSL